MVFFNRYPDWCFLTLYSKYFRRYSLHSFNMGCWNCRSSMWLSNSPDLLLCGNYSKYTYILQYICSLQTTTPSSFSLILSYTITMSYDDPPQSHPHYINYAYLFLYSFGIDNVNGDFNVCYSNKWRGAGGRQLLHDIKVSTIHSLGYSDKQNN